MTTRSVATLHVTNGDSVLYMFKKAGLLGKQIAWRDALNEGPVPAGLSLQETSEVRVRYLAESGYASPIKLIHEFQARDAMLLRAAEFEEVVLWFEHDLYDQLQLLQILTVLDELALEPGRVSLVQSDHYLGSMTAEEISALLPRRRTVTAATLASGKRGWARFTSGNAQDVLAGAQEDAIGLPFLRAGMRRLCEEFPWTGDGLSRSQRQALASVAQGPATDQELFRRAQAREEAQFLGDTGFYKILDVLGAEPAPLIEGAPDARTTTPLGRRVMAGDTDWLESREIDRWIGGSHLTPANAPRWDDEKVRFFVP